MSFVPCVRLVGAAAAPARWFGEPVVQDLLMAQEPVHYQADGGGEVRAAVVRSVSRARVTAGPAGCRDPPAGPSQELPGRPRHASRAGPCRRDGDRGGPGARRVHSTAARWLAEAGL